MDYIAFALLLLALIWLGLVFCDLIRRVRSIERIFDTVSALLEELDHG